MVDDMNNQKVTTELLTAVPFPGSPTRASAITRVTPNSDRLRLTEQALVA